MTCARNGIAKSMHEKSTTVSSAMKKTETHKMKKYRTKRELCNLDRITQIAGGYGNIPAGAVVDLNCYTQVYQIRYANVIYEGKCYYVLPEDIEPVLDEIVQTTGEKEPVD